MIVYYGDAIFGEKKSLNKMCLIRRFFPNPLSMARSQRKHNAMVSISAFRDSVLQLMILEHRTAKLDQREPGGDRQAGKGGAVVLLIHSPDWGRRTCIVFEGRKAAMCRPQEEDVRRCHGEDVVFNVEFSSFHLLSLCAI